MRRVVLLPFLPSCLLFFVLALAWAAYTPGLHGGFVFDDYANLPALGATGPIDHFPTLLRYITSGVADPTGRPMALLSFLVDAHDWPASPYPFKRTNVLLHLANAALLFLLLSRLARACVGDAATDRRLLQRMDIAAVLAAGLWVLHPLFVSTTLYIVQREAMLPATFALIGLNLWLAGRQRMARGESLRGALLVLVGLVGCTALGVLSKANGALLSLYALVVEYVLLAPRESAETVRGAYRRLMLTCAWLPAAMVMAYLAWQGWIGLTRGIGNLRPWTLGQRLLTEPRILFDYLRLLWIPRPFTSGVFNEQYTASRSLSDPSTTWIAIAGVVALLAAVPLLRRRWPALALAIGFFLAAHLVESSTIALELYYEHRNYVPALLLFWPLALAIVGVSPRFEPASAARTRTHDLGFAALATALLLGLAGMTWANASIWGDSREQALIWARLNPESPRAQTNAATQEMSSGHPEAAMRRLIPMLAKDPSQIQVALNLVGAQCMRGAVTADALAAAANAMATSRDPGALLVGWSGRAIETAREGSCRGFDLAAMELLVDHGLRNPYFGPGRRQDIEHIRGAIALAYGDAPTALAYFDRAIDEEPRMEIALQQSAMLGDAGFPREGLAHLDHFSALGNAAQVAAPGMPRIHQWVLARQDYWGTEYRRIRANLVADEQTQSQTGTKQ
jgi:tetratricopeptide (TPR) repeat protein